MLLVTPELFLLWQAKVSAVKKAYCETMVPAVDIQEAYYETWIVAQKDEIA